MPQGFTKLWHNIPKKYKIKGIWRDFQTYAKEYKIDKYKFGENYVIMKEEFAEMEKEFIKAGKIKDWESWIKTLPTTKGVYAIVNNGEVSHYAHRFLEIGTGGYFKDKDPNVSIEDLKKKWYASDHRVMYIGRANFVNGHSRENNSTIQSRVKLYMKFGGGKNVGHYGGRYIWQLEDSGEFDVYFFSCDNPQEKEMELIEKYKPFANLNGGDVK